MSRCAAANSLVHGREGKGVSCKCWIPRGRWRGGAPPEKKGGKGKFAAPPPLVGVEHASRTQSGARGSPVSSRITPLVTGPRARAPGVLAAAARARIIQRVAAEDAVQSHSAPYKSRTTGRTSEVRSAAVSSVEFLPWRTATVRPSSPSTRTRRSSPRRLPTCRGRNRRSHMRRTDHHNKHGARALPS